MQKIASFFKAQSKHFVLIKLVIRINAKDRDTLKSKKKNSNVWKASVTSNYSGLASQSLANSFHDLH